MAGSVARPHVLLGLPKTQLAERDRTTVSQRIAGLLLMVSGVATIMSWLTAEALYPPQLAYSIHANSLSHLGATEPPNSVAYQPSASIFDVTLMVAGLMLIAAGFLTFRAYRAKRVSIPMSVFGFAVLGVGIFALNVNVTIHTIVALLAFTSGSVMIILASTIAPSGFRYMWMALGVVALVAISLGLFAPDWGPITALGLGGIERWNVYPIALWLVAFGGLLLGGYQLKVKPARR